MTGQEPTGGASIGDHLVSARSFEEYRAMFALTDDHLRGRVLDCPGGAAGFTATSCGRGTDALAVDPVYVVPPGRLEERVSGELARGRAFAAADPQRYVWDFYGDPAGHSRHRAESAALLARDRRAHPARYVPASLPHLPFADRTFDLVLSSHLLFTYADRLDDGLHLAALRELARVSRGAVRVYPLVDQAGGALPDLLGHLVGRLSADGLQARVRDVGYEFQRGARTMLELVT